MNTGYRLSAGSTPAGGWPPQYLRVVECRSGEQFVTGLSARASLDLKRQVKRWIREEFGGELWLDGDLMPRLEGEYYAEIITDGRPPDTGVCWDSGGFFLKETTK